ncbi:MAG TPA: hypothetical protein VGF43_22855 [Dongiaceae bacterium]|jgi:hypothetical protein
MIDKAFGAQAVREPQRPGGDVLERERAFSERARKIEALKRTRMHHEQSREPDAKAKRKVAKKSAKRR